MRDAASLCFSFEGMLIPPLPTLFCILFLFSRWLYLYLCFFVLVFVFLFLFFFSGGMLIPPPPLFCILFLFAFAWLLWSRLHNWHWCEASWMGSTSSPCFTGGSLTTLWKRTKLYILYLDDEYHFLLLQLKAVFLNLVNFHLYEHFHYTLFETKQTIVVHFIVVYFHL